MQLGRRLVQPNEETEAADTVFHLSQQPVERRMLHTSLPEGDGENPGEGAGQKKGQLLKRLLFSNIHLLNRGVSYDHYSKHYRSSLDIT